MAETNCRKIECCDTSSGVLGDFSGFSLVGGDYPGGDINGNPESSFIVECPPGVTCVEGTYPTWETIPKDQIIFPYDIPTTGEIVLRVPCQTGDIVRVYPEGTSASELQTALYEMFHECGQAEADLIPQTASLATLYANKAISPIMCDGLKFSAAPGGLLQFDDATKTASLPGGCFTSYVSQATADGLASNYVSTQITAFKAGGGQCGYWNAAQSVSCPNGTTQDVAANTYFSTSSQSAADQLAIDAATAACPAICDDAFNGFTWTLLSTGCGPLSQLTSNSASGPNAAMSVDLGATWVCAAYQSSSINIPGTVDCYITFTGASLCGTGCGTAKCYVNGVLKKTYSAGTSGTELIHITGTGVTWNFRIEVQTVGYAYTSGVSASLFLGS